MHVAREKLVFVGRRYLFVPESILIEDICQMLTDRNAAKGPSIHVLHEDQSTHPVKSSTASADEPNRKAL
jgi:hypothetical protein